LRTRRDSKYAASSKLFVAENLRFFENYGVFTQARVSGLVRQCG